MLKVVLNLSPVQALRWQIEDASIYNVVTPLWVLELRAALGDESHKLLRFCVYRISAHDTLRAALGDESNKL